MKRLVLVFILFNLYLIAHTQVIKGTVFDQKTKEAIYSASVYLNGTFVGELTDKNGSFELDISKYPAMPVTVSALGYYTKTLTNVSDAKPFTIYMEPKLFELNEVVINAKSRSRDRRSSLTIFRTAFIGETVYASNCIITNEDDINFRYSPDRDTLTAYALKPILIDNKALGYKIVYYLDKFEYCKHEGSFTFKGNIVFKEDMSTDPVARHVFEENRESAYLGSRMHFFRALWLEDLTSAGFTVKNHANEPLNNRKFIIQDEAKRKFIKYHEPLGICYNSKVPRSYMVFLKERVFFDKNGYFDPAGLSWQGNMGQQRIADLLPFEYKIKEK
jgi:hypothetical protein